MFDAVDNNADHKGDRILAMGDRILAMGDRHGYDLDHEITFRGVHKLRTVL